MKITLYFINWNDSFYLPFIKNHYGKFCQRIVMYDNYSTDGSQELAMSLGFEVREFGVAGRLDDQNYLDVKNHCWKEERENGQQADRVIVCDADEFLKLEKLAICSDIPLVKGYNIISDTLPVGDSIFELNTGEGAINYSKQVIFNPKVVSEINFVHGCHLHHMVTAPFALRDRSVCFLYHFRQIGGIERLIARHAEYRPRMSPFNVRNKMGHHYLEDDNQRRAEWAKLQAEARELW